MNDDIYDGPPDYRSVGAHGVFPETTHDQVERYNFLAHLNRHLAASVLPGVARAYEARVAPAFAAEHGREPRNRKEVRKALASEPIHQAWSALRRNTMEMRQQAGLSVVLPQLAALMERAERLTPPERLQLDEGVRMPDYLTAVDQWGNAVSWIQSLFAGFGSGLLEPETGIVLHNRGALFNLQAGHPNIIAPGKRMVFG